MAGVAARGCDHTRETTLEFRPGVERNVASFFQSLSAIGEIVCVMDRTRKMLIVLIRVDFFFSVGFFSFFFREIFFFFLHVHVEHVKVDRGMQSHTCLFLRGVHAG